MESVASLGNHIQKCGYIPSSAFTNISQADLSLQTVHGQDQVIMESSLMSGISNISRK
jgi:hypothetical protein